MKWLDSWECTLGMHEEMREMMTTKWGKLGKGDGSATPS
jgi:hypothetical protein